MARDNVPAYTPVEADATGERTAENQGDGTVTEPQADQADQSKDESTTQETGAAKDTTAQEEAARKQAEEDAQALHKARTDGAGYVGREANPEVGGESFPTFAPER